MGLVSVLPGLLRPSFPLLPPSQHPFLIDAATSRHLSYSTFLRHVSSLSASLRPLLSQIDVAFILSLPICLAIAEASKIRHLRPPTSRCRHSQGPSGRQIWDPGINEHICDFEPPLITPAAPELPSLHQICFYCRRKFSQRRSSSYPVAVTRSDHRCLLLQPPVVVCSPERPRPATKSLVDALSPFGDGKQISPKLFHGSVLLLSRFYFCCWCLLVDEHGYFVKDDGSFVNSGYWGLKNLKDAVSSIPSSTPNKPKKLIQIWKSMTIYRSHLSCLGLKFVSLSLWVEVFVSVCFNVSCSAVVVVSLVP